MLDAGTIHPSQSPWCNAVMLVRIKDGTLHFCMDSRQLNAQTKKDSYPLPRIQEALESMADAAHFSSMDLKSRFWQVKMAPGSQPYMAFTMGNLGFYEFTRMPFGLCNAPATFQRLMQNTLGELNLTYCIIYLNHVSKEGVHPSKDNVHVIEEFPMPETFTQVRAFCGLAGHYRQFIKEFTNIAHLLYDVLGKEMKMGPVQLPLEAHEAAGCLRRRS